jgi:hypothetical protein
LACKSEYDPPGIGTISPIFSGYAEDVGTNFVKQIASVLEDKGLVNAQSLFVPHEGRRVRLDDYLDRVPIRKHKRHWIDGGKQVAVFHPITNLPFFINNSGSKICRLCDGKYTVARIIARFKKEWATQKSDEGLTLDLMRFLLLMEELGLIEFVG